MVGLAYTVSANAQDLGHRLPGTLGLFAGRQPQAGVYVADQIGSYTADQVRDRSGQPLTQSGFDLNVLANGFGVGATLEAGNTFVNFSLSVPVARVQVTAVQPETSIDKFGIADARAQLLGVGWRFRRFEVVTSYALYIPTGRFQPGASGGLSRGSFTHELSLGGTVFLDASKRWYVSALASYNLDQRKFGVDITRGDTFQVQGGAGIHLFEVLDVGLAGYALWQVRDDQGADVPDVLRGARDRVFGLGPELAGFIPPIRTRLSLRYEHDFAVKARPEGQLFVFTATLYAWQPGQKP